MDNVYLLWYQEIWQEPELIDVYRSNEKAEKVKEKLVNKLTEQMKNQLKIRYYVEERGIK